MENIYFYPILTDTLKEDCGLVEEQYVFSYFYQGSQFPLSVQDGAKTRLSDPLGNFKIETDGLLLEKSVQISYNHLLHGPSGIACTGAELGVCIIWTNKKLTQTGCIFPSQDEMIGTSRTCTFTHQFLPNELAGDLELSMILYIKKSAETVLLGEESLMNEEGVSVGEISFTNIAFDDFGTIFPIQECSTPDEPLWWVEFAEWEDPTVDYFSKENLCLYLNKYYDLCPDVSTTAKAIKNFDMLVDIMAQVYLLVIGKLSNDELAAIESGSAEENSICGVLSYLYTQCPHPLRIRASQEKLLRDLQINLRILLSGGTA